MVLAISEYSLMRQRTCTSVVFVGTRAAAGHHLFFGVCMNPTLHGDKTARK